MIDRFGREITRLRISVTDRCNLRCVYCRPPDDPRGNVLSYEEIVRVVRIAAAAGVRKVRLTGGEPTVRRDIDVLVRMIAAIDGIEEIAMSTNGVLLASPFAGGAPMAQALARAGLDRVNISLDSVDPERYRAITRGGDLNRVLAGIEAAREAGLEPIKLNCVVENSSDEPDACQVARFAGENGLEVRFIHQMDFHTGKFSVVEGGTGGDCSRCNKLRLSSDGRIRPCLFSDLSFSVEELGPDGAIEAAVRAKPERGSACSRSWIRITGG